MRIALALALTLAACGDDHGTGTTTHPIDATLPGGPDADLHFCDSPASSAHVSIVAGTTTGFTNVHAGGTEAGGAVAPLLAAGDVPMSLLLMFVNEAHVPETTLYECTAPNQGCPYDGIVGRVDCIGCDTELGPHPIMLQSLQQNVTVQGTLTITDFVQPFQHAPGHITGSIESPGAVIAGTFENDFCQLLLSVTI